jgi:hypothetical protein
MRRLTAPTPHPKANAEHSSAAAFGRHLLPQGEKRRTLCPPHVSAALPTTGVEGAAMSRAAIGPAR